MIPLAQHPRQAPVAHRRRLVAEVLAILTVASSFIVKFEPAPCDLLFGFTFVVALLTNRKLVLPGAGFMIYAGLFGIVVTNLVPMALSPTPVGSIRFAGITFYLLALFLCFSGLIGVGGLPTARRLLAAFGFAAACSAAIGILARFQLLPNSEMFFRDRTGLRINSTFKDPNVFAPFLVAAFFATLAELLQHVRFRWRHVGLLVLYATAILLAFSRGAYAHLALSLFVFVSLHFLVIRSPQAVRRLTGAGLVVLAVGVPVLIMALASAGLDDFLLKRLQLQDYDVNERFANHAAVFQASSDNLQGLGPGVWEPDMGVMAVHNLYLRVMVENGLLGLVALLTFLGAVIAQMMQGIWRRGPDAGIHAACLAVVIGAMGESWVIDTLHWRHLFLVLSVPVGLNVYLLNARARTELVHARAA